MCPKYKIQNLVNKTLCLLKELTYLTIIQSRSNESQDSTKSWDLKFKSLQFYINLFPTPSFLFQAKKSEITICDELLFIKCE